MTEICMSCENQTMEKSLKIKIKFLPYNFIILISFLHKNPYIHQFHTLMC